MSGASARTFNLPLHQHEHYWISVCAKTEFSAATLLAMQNAGLKKLDGSILAGDKIIPASKALGIEHMIDRHLQVQAIKTFVSSAFNGFLFVNFFPGFIHRPSVYLEGLSETVKSFGVVPKHIV